MKEKIFAIPGYALTPEYENPSFPDYHETILQKVMNLLQNNPESRVLPIGGIDYCPRRMTISQLVRKELIKMGVDETRIINVEKIGIDTAGELSTLKQILDLKDICYRAVVFVGLSPHIYNVRRSWEKMTSYHADIIVIKSKLSMTRLGRLQWDVMCFWLRFFDPLGVRWYSQRHRRERATKVATTEQQKRLVV